MHRRRSPAAFAPRRQRLLLLSPLACLVAADGAGPTTAAAASAVSTVAVYVPGYGAGAWSELRGSILASDSTATTYTIFCADSNVQHCQITGDLPFVFAESPSSLFFGGVDPETITASLGCDLEGTTAATCTGSTSFGAGYEGGPFTGPTETSWTSTLTGTDVDWGVLTLAEPAPAATAAASLSSWSSGAAGGATGTGAATLAETPCPTDTAWFYPTATGRATGDGTASGAASGTPAGGARGWAWPAAAVLLARVYLH